MPLNELEAEQRRRNVESRNTWQRYARHRRRVTELLLETLDESAQTGSPTRPRKLCLLGAGNCNDVDLRLLTEAFDEIHLVDLDGIAMAEGVLRAGLEEAQDRIRIHADVDVSGIFPALSPLDRTAGSDEIESLAKSALCSPIPDGLDPLITGGFDTVASVGLLSQLIEGILTRITNPASALPVLAAVRSRHLLLLLELARPGGCGVLVTEIVSTDSAPELEVTPEDELLPLLRHLVNQGNFFTGLNPAILQTGFQQDPRCSPLVATVQTATPWKWDFLCRTYAVTAFVARRNR